MPHKKKVRNTKTILPNATKKYRTGLYLRLSGEEIAKGEKLKNQKELLLNYVKAHPELQVMDVYSDNGETGTNFDRPEWMRLIEDIKINRIDCIIVKDLSRFGRNYIETGNYLEVIFPMFEIRFISVNDNYDTGTLDKDALQPLDTMIKGIVNEAYAKDISRKIFTAKEIQRKKGLYYGNVPPYGYCKDPANPHHLIIDAETAPTVQQIFEWKLQRASNSEIANRLNSSNIAAPMRYQFLKGAVKSSRFEHSVWQGITIKVLLSNRTYTGDLAMGKKRKNLSQNLTIIRSIPYEDWTITENTHEAIISRETFFEVQRICMDELEVNRAFRYRHSEITDPEDLFTGLVYSKNTEQKMYRTRTYYEEHGMKYRYTTTSVKNGSCPVNSVVSIKEDQIRESLVFFLQRQMELVLELKDSLDEIKNHEALTAKKEKLDKQIELLSADVRMLLSRQQSLYQDYSNGLLTKQKYLELKELYKQNQSFLEKQHTEQTQNARLLELRFSPQNAYIQLLMEFYETGVLSRDFLQRMVNKIYVCDSKTIEVILNYRDEIEPILKFLECEVLSV